MDEFARSKNGRKFFESDVPRIATALEKIASELDRQNTARDLEQDGAVKFCEMVWIIYETNDGLEGAERTMDVRASEQSARDIMRDRLDDREEHAAADRAAWWKRIEAWDGMEDLQVGPWHITVKEVNL
jgi:hypothetical protein